MTGSILPVAGALGEVDGVLLQRLVGALRVGRGDLAVAAHGAERGEQGVAGGAGAGRGRRRPRRPEPASPTSRCSVETYSSPRALACSPAALMHAQQLAGRRGRGDGRAADAGHAGAARRRPWPGRRPGRRRRRVSSGPAMPSVCSSSATSRCSGSSAAWPRSTASRWAAVMASCERVVSLLSMVGGARPLGWRCGRSLPAAVWSPVQRATELSLFRSTLPGPAVRPGLDAGPHCRLRRSVLDSAHDRPAGAERGARRPAVLRAVRRLPRRDRPLPAHARRARADLSAVPGHDAALGGRPPDRRPARLPPGARQRHALARCSSGSPPPAWSPATAASRTSARSPSRSPTRAAPCGTRRSPSPRR